MDTQDPLTPYKLSDRDLAEGLWKETPCFLAESQALLLAAAETGSTIKSMLTTEDFPFPDLPCEEFNVIGKEEFRRATGYYQMRSVVGICTRPPQPTLDELLNSAKRVLVIEDSTNGANIASLFRIAYGLGIDCVLTTHSCADPLFRRAARMSKGDCLRVPWARIGSRREWASELIPLFRQKGFKLAALALDDDSISLQDLPKPEKLMLVMGTEGEGLQAKTIELCDWTVKIPMRDGVDSLNVAAAAAVACWQATR